MLPPRSLICNVTMASAIQTVAKTPLKTSERWSSRALMERRKDKSKQKSKGPLKNDSQQTVIECSACQWQISRTKDPNP